MYFLKLNITIKLLNNKNPGFYPRLAARTVEKNHTVLNGVLQMVYLSAPYTFEDPQPGTGYGLSIFLIDAASGILRGMRYVGLSTEFSKNFRTAVERQRQLPFKSSDYFANINHVNKNYSTRELVQRASEWCKIK